jgi:hypothetical protein
MTYSLEETVAGNANGGNNNVAQKGDHKLRQPKPNQAASRVALAAAQRQAAEAQHRLDELRAILLDLRQERDAWREQAQRLALREKQTVKRPAWWHWGTGG